MKAKAAAATLPPTKEEELTKQLKYQQHQIDTLVGHVKNLVPLVRATQPSSNVARTGNPLMGEGVIAKSPKAQRKEVLGERVTPSAKNHSSA